MPRSSENVAALASALAKAQAELVNPEKSLTATIRTGRPGEVERSFRYAPLSSGLDIVRRTLGQHEIATIQTTAIEQGMVRLTTMLAHASGEWIASDWPVCPVAETANPQRMGAALTYARRYALFTLVGIAGEDDLDAPDLCAPSPLSTEPTADLPSPSRFDRPGNGRARPAAVRGPVLSPAESSALRGRLLDQITSLQSHGDATAWAQGALPTKNRLTPDDARRVESAFAERLATFPAADAQSETAADVQNVPAADTQSELAVGGPNVQGTAADPDVGASPVTAHNAPTAPRRCKRTPESDRQSGAGVALESPGIDKSVLAIPAPRRHRDPEHLRSVVKQSCLVCGRKPSDPHHLRYLQPRALGRKASDEFVVPLCRVHHREVHRASNEPVWWNRLGIDPAKAAALLWQRTRAGRGMMEEAHTASPTTSFPPTSDQSARVHPGDPSPVQP